VTFGKWRVQVVAACLEDPSIVREHKMVFRVDTLEGMLPSASCI
jgi:hypothetical protein